MKNLHLLFHKTYYSKLGCDLEELRKFMEDCNRQLFSAAFEQADYIPSRVPNTVSVLMQVGYPGLLIGMSYNHGAGITEEDIDTGFLLDYVSGQPYIPGSAVKGVLRSGFAHPQVIADLLPQAADCIAQLERDIFEESDTVRDVFLDAVVRRGDRYKHLLARDFITSHKLGINRNPVPVQVIKLAPEVVLEFRFVLKDSLLTTPDGSEITVTAAEKLNLFTALLELFGIGAKTNTGYGALTAVSEADLEIKVEADVLPLKGEPVVGEIYTATVTGMNEQFAFIQLDGRNTTDRVHRSKIANKYVDQISKFLSVGQRVRVKYIQSDINGQLRGQFSIRDTEEQKVEVSV